MGGGAKTICWRLSETEIVDWPLLKQAFEAAATVPCAGHGCRGAHAVAYPDDGRIRVRGLPRPVLPLSFELERLYP